MVNTDKHNVRVHFVHGNALNLDLGGCGSVYIEPNKDYFFEDAPLKFINYLAQLRRLGVTYKLTNDKKGCFRTINVSKYLDNDPIYVMNKLRSNISNNAPKSEIIPTTDDESDIPNLIKPSESTTEFTEEELEQINDTNTSEAQEVETKETEGTNEEPTTEGTTETPEVTEESTNEEPEVVETKPLEDMNKSELIEYAHSLGLNEIDDAWTKKEIREAITSSSK